jgi:hypothetical protein
MARPIGFVLLLLIGARPAVAQDHPAFIAGIITDTAGTPLAGAVVEERLALVSTRTGSGGQFRLGPLLPGPSQLRARLVGYVPASFPLILSADSTLSVVVRLSAAPITVDSIAVTGKSADSTGGTQAMLGGFFDRARDRERGAGSSTFVSPEDVRRRRPQKVSDLLRDIPGLRLRYEQGIAIPYGRDGRCIMNIWVNGQLIDRLYSGQDAFNAPSYFRRPPGGAGVVSATVSATESSGGVDGFLPALEVDAVEVYLAPSEVPPRFDSLRNQCGTIVIWTR